MGGTIAAFCVFVGCWLASDTQPVSETIAFTRYFPGSIESDQVARSFFAVALPCLGLVLLGKSIRYYGWSRAISFVILCAVLFVVTPTICHIIERRDAQAKANLFPLVDPCTKIYAGSNSLPIRFSEVVPQITAYDRLKNAWAAARKAAFYKRADNVLGDEWEQFLSAQKKLYGVDKSGILNLATGYETGRDYFGWWDCFPEDLKIDEGSFVVRSIVAGNILYLPLGEDGDILPYDSDSNEAKDVMICYFLFPTSQGSDMWTPTGNPKKPITLNQDGIPDGVYLLYWASKEVEKEAGS
jgi:hypothetical protein